MVRNDLSGDGPDSWLNVRQDDKAPSEWTADSSVQTFLPMARRCRQKQQKKPASVILLTGKDSEG